MSKRDKVKVEGLEVHVNLTGDHKKDRESVDVALRELKKKIKKSGMMQELRTREAYMSPSKYKKFRRNESIKLRKREERKREWSQKNKNN